MIFQMSGLLKRGNVCVYRKTVLCTCAPSSVRGRSSAGLGTSDEAKAMVLWRKVSAEVDLNLAEAEKGIASPAVATYKASRTGG
jgi:hypothetical protein